MTETPNPQSANPAPRQAARCSEMVSPGGQWGSFHMARCKRKAVIERQGKPFCTIHDPVARKAKLEAAMKKDREKWDAIRKMEERTKACVNALENVSNPAAVKQLIEASRFLIETWGFNFVPPMDCKANLVNALAALDAPVATKDLGSETPPAQEVTTQRDRQHEE